MELNFIFSIAILIMSVVVHEVSHGYVAELFGDPTARLSGRLTLNPVKHLDPVGSLLVPLFLFIIKSPFLIGWAKPVLYNPYNFTHVRLGTALTAAAGVIANICIAVLFGLLIRFAPVLGIASGPFVALASTIVFINLILAVFNFIPVPPLDGSKVLFSLLPYRFSHIEEIMGRYWLVLIVLVIFFASGFIAPLAGFLFSLVTGISF